LEESLVNPSKKFEIQITYLKDKIEEIEINLPKPEND